jgi:hypothetical protein
MVGLIFGAEYASQLEDGYWAPSTSLRAGWKPFSSNPKIPGASLWLVNSLTHMDESYRLKQMSKRLQVILEDPDYREIQRAARARRMSIAQWVRQALEQARRGEPTGNMGKKLEAVRRGAQQEFPAPDIDAMLAEIETGYTQQP